jgi:long-chain acyl-CoA synthetase
MEIRHLGLMILDSCERGGDRVAARCQRDDRWLEFSFADFGRRFRALAGWLRDGGFAAGDRAAIFSQNRPEWAMADFAVQVLRGASVPVYATNTAAQLRYILDDAAVGVLFVGGADQQATAREAVADMDRPPTIVTFDDPLPSLGDGVLSLEALTDGDGLAESDLRAELDQASADEVATIIYTSGTTGEPKGVQLTHANFSHQAAAVAAAFDVGPDDRSLCFLPLSHVYERSWSYFVYAVGAQTTYLEDPRQVVDTMQEVRPTVMVSVPRLYEKIYGTVWDRVEHAPALRRALFSWAVGIGFQANSKRFRGGSVGPWLALRHAVADTLVLSKIREIVGGPKNFFSAGGAPLAKEIEEFFLAAGLLVCQGYGLTETSPMVSYNTPGAFLFGTVGRPVPGCEVRIAADGEIQVRGPNVMVGYHNKPEATDETFVDGWFRTGDVGTLNDDGYLRITDRIKDLIITSGGKNIAPQAVEMAIGKDHFIEQIAVIGDQKPYVGALVVPTFPVLEEWAGRQGIEWSDHADLVAKPEVEALYRDRIDGQSHELAHFEQVKRFRLLTEAFTQEAGEITPTLKLRRKQIVERRRADIDALYDQST